MQPLASKPLPAKVRYQARDHQDQTGMLLVLTRIQPLASLPHHSSVDSDNATGQDAESIDSVVLSVHLSSKR